MAMTLRKQREQEKAAELAKAAATAALPSSSVSNSETETSTGASAGATNLLPQLSDSSYATSPKSNFTHSHTSSRRASDVDSESDSRKRFEQDFLGNVDGFEDFSELTGEHRGKSLARFLHQEEEEERGRRGRSSRTPESVGTVQMGGGASGADDVMDWRMKSKSRSRSRSVSAMDWRSHSRSMSRRRPMAPQHDRRLSRIDDEETPDDKLLSTSAPQSSGFNLSEFAVFEEDGEGDADFWGDTLPFLQGSLAQRRQSAGAAGRSSNSGEEAAQKAARRERMKQEFRQAVHANLFQGEQAEDSRNVPFVYGGRKTSMDMNALGGANAFGAPTAVLGSVPGIGDFTSHAANHHPEYGFLPRLVRKTSFDHKVRDGRSMSRGPGRDRSRMGRKSSAEETTRKRPFRDDASPARPLGIPLPTTSDQRLAAGLSRLAPPPNAFVNFIPSTSFDFAIPAPPSVQQANAVLQNPNAIALLEALATSQSNSPASSGPAGLMPSNHGSPVGASQSSNGAPPLPLNAGPPATNLQPGEVQTLMNIFANSDAMLSQRQQQSFTHINPNQLFGQQQYEGIPAATYPHLGSQSDGASSWGYSPSNSAGSPSGTASPMTSQPHVYMPHLPSPLSINRAGDPAPASEPPRANSSKSSAPIAASGAGTKASATTAKSNATASSSKVASTIEGDAGGSEEPTSCSNCNTTKTPLWRRDPEGQPLCEFADLFVRSGMWLDADSRSRAWCRQRVRTLLQAAWSRPPTFSQVGRHQETQSQRHGREEQAENWLGRFFLCFGLGRCGWTSGIRIHGRFFRSSWLRQRGRNEARTQRLMQFSPRHGFVSCRTAVSHSQWPIARVCNLYSLHSHRTHHRLHHDSRILCSQAFL